MPMPCRAGVAKCIYAWYNYRSYNRTRLSVSYKLALLNLYQAIVSYACIVSACMPMLITMYTKSPMLPSLPPIMSILCFKL